MPILNWLGKEQAVRTAQNCKYRLLEHVPRLSYGEPDTDNMLIKGDNLEALKSLIPTHAGRVKCVFVDVPYNTKSAFEHYDDNLEHSTWLSMMYPRLELLQQLLREDGSIWITINDNESHYMKVICDEIFGRSNFISNSIWQKKYSPSNDAMSLSEDHDHILVYAKSKAGWIPNKLPRSSTAVSSYKNHDNDPRGPWKSSDYTCNKSSTERPNLYYAVIHPVTREEIWPKKTAVWRYSFETHQNHVKNNLIWWGKDGKNKIPAFKRLLCSIDNSSPHQSVWLWQEVGHTQDAKREAQLLNSESPFSTPKPEKLLERVIRISTNPNDLVLDSFLGSATTSAVAHKLNRRHVGIELGEHAITHCQPRLKKVIDGEQGGISKDVNWHGGGGFKFFRLGEAIFNENGSLLDSISFSALASYIWFSDTRTSLNQKEKSPLLGVHNGVAYYLLYEDILGDNRPAGGNILTSKVLTVLPEHPLDAKNGKKVIYGETSRIGAERLKSENIIFKQIPYDVLGR